MKKALVLLAMVLSVACGNRLTEPTPAASRHPQPAGSPTDHAVPRR